MLRYGSAPRVRGTRKSQVAKSFYSALSAVQPRVYGELILARDHTLRIYRLDGSAPRVRGTLPYQFPVSIMMVFSVQPRVYGELSTGSRLCLIADRSRFSPACTGNSRSKRSATTVASVQPRVYGELPVRCVQPHCHGSAPRVRGTLEISTPNLFRRTVNRFSPACTGNSVT